MSADHFDDGKPGLQHLPLRALLEVAKVGDYGAKKYSQDNWRSGMAWTRVLGSCFRHLAQFTMGSDIDPESNLPHLAHLAWDVLMVLEYMFTHPEMDDRYNGKWRVGQDAPAAIPPYPNECTEVEADDTGCWDTVEMGRDPSLY